MMSSSPSHPYKTYSRFLAEHFDGKVQKITVNTRGTCPNRDGSLSRGGCIYCNNQSFSPSTSSYPTASVQEQIDAGKRFFARKYPSMRYLAYFQSYTNTYGDTNRLLDLYHEALDAEDVVGIIIGTRPDCMPDDLLRELASINASHKVFIEYGAETSHDSTLRAINRCHTWDDTVHAVRRTADAGIPVGLHFILGLPGETTDMMMQTVDHINALPVDCVKFHQLQIIKGTRLAAMYASDASCVRLFDVDGYAGLCAGIVKRLRNDIAIERFVSQSPDGLLIAPRWGLKNYQFSHILARKLSEMDNYVPMEWR